MRSWRQRPATGGMPSPTWADRATRPRARPTRRTPYATSGLPWLDDLLRDLRSGLLAAAVVASYLPARLVAEISSVEALKSE